MIPNEYHKLLAAQILGCDIERLDAAIREETGHGLMSYLKANLPKKHGGNLKFKNFNLVRFAFKDHCDYVGKEPAHDGAAAKVWGLTTRRTTDGGGVAEGWCNDKQLFAVTANSFSRVQNLAISALHGYIGRTRRAHNKKKPAKVYDPAVGTGDFLNNVLIDPPLNGGAE